MFRSQVLRSVVAAVFLLGNASAARSQEARASLGGRVSDATGAVIPGAAIAVTSDDTGVTQRTSTSDQGNWLVEFLLPGRYHFTASAPGFKTIERNGIVLQTADTKIIDVTLEVGATEQSVTVTAEASLLDATSATSGAVITSREIAEIPSTSRVSTLLATLAPGVVAQDQANNVIRLWSYYGASQFSATGGNGIRSNNYLLDGIPNTKSGGYVSYIPTTDTLQEFRVQTNAYDAEIGRQAGATINMQTKAGTKQYHGSLFEYNQNNVLNARQFNLKKGVIHLNQYGGTFGGPVWLPKAYSGKQKTFFFFSYEGLRNSNPQISIRSVPTELERSGDFSQSYNIVNGTRFPVNIYDPATVDVAGNRKQFDGNRILSNRLNSIAQNILAYVPLPNQPADLTQGNAVNNFQSANFRGDRMASVNLRIDHQWNNAHRSFLIYRWDYNTEVQGNDFADAATGVYQTRSPRALGLDHVWTISSNKVLDLKVGVNRFVEWTLDGGAYANFDQASLGLPARLVSQLHPAFPSISGFAGGFGTNVNTYTMNTYYTYSAGFLHMHANHLLKYGAEYWVLQQANGNWGQQPQFRFGPEWTRPNATVGGGTNQGSSFASFLLGLPDGGNIDNNASGYYSQRFIGLYFQDNWRLARKLTLNLGLRWDYERPVVERFDRMTSNYDPKFLSPINAQAQAAYAAIMNPRPAPGTPLAQLLQLVPVSSFQVLGAQLFAGVNGQPRTAHRADYHEFQPRLGFAYQITPTTVIRGGVGRFTQASWDNAGQNGFSQNTAFVATNNDFFTPNDTLSNPFQSGVLPAKGSAPGAYSNLGNNPYWISQHPDRPYSWNYSLTLQKEHKGWLFELGYAHNKSSALPVNQIDNFSSFDVWKQLRTPTFDSTGRPADKLMWDQSVPNPFYHIPGLVVTSTDYSSTTIALNQLLRPVTVLGDGLVRGGNPIGSNQYDAMVVKVQHRFSKGFSMLSAFTWSKTFDDTGFWGPQISGYVLEHRLQAEDRPFHLSVAPTWDLPFGRNGMVGRQLPRAVDLFVGGWELTGTFTIQSGTPVQFPVDSFFAGRSFGLARDGRSIDKWFDTSAFMPFPSRNTCLQGNPFCNPANIVNYPAWTGIQNLPGFNYYGKPSDYDSRGNCKGVCNGVYQDFATFVRRYPTRFGDVRNPRVNEVNLGMFKNFAVSERVRLQYRFEVFNAFNHVRFGGPNFDPGSTGFGKITPVQQNQARQIQMALKLSF